MEQNPRKVKRRYFPKDWERRARVQEALYEQHRTLGDLGVELGINNGYLSSLVWGTQRNSSWEERIAESLGKTWGELFSPLNAGRSAA